jgi:hypothetical protein
MPKKSSPKSLKKAHARAAAREAVATDTGIRPSLMALWNRLPRDETKPSRCVDPETPEFKAFMALRLAGHAHT